VWLAAPPFNYNPKKYPKSTEGHSWKAAAAAPGFRDLQLQLQLQLYQNILGQH